MSTSAAASSAGSSLLGGNRSASFSTTSGAQLSNVNTNAALFREIHKNTWLKRLTADGKKVTVGPKKSERSWVVFCVHDDSKALLEGYAEPRQAASHNPEWVVSMQETQHISHALIPNSHEFEFVVTLSHEVVRFHAMSWEVMQEWVETLRSKLREMKILSPRENLYTKLPEIRAPLLPTRDPTSPLPAPPPVPAALVPGVERVVPQSVLHSTVDITALATTAATSEPCPSVASTGSTATASTATLTSSSISTNYFSNNQTIQSMSAMTPHSSQFFNISPPNLTSMSNTLSQNLLNMLSDPITAYSEQLHGDNFTSDITSATSFNEELLDSPKQKSRNSLNEDQATAMESIESNNEIITTNENSFRLDVGNTERNSSDQNNTMENLTQCEKIAIRPQTSRSHSLGNVDATRQQQLANDAVNFKSQTKSSISNNIILEPEISQETEITEATTTTATDPETNITIIQVTNAHEKPLTEYASNKQNKNLEKTMSGTAEDIFTFPENSEISKNEEYKSNVQIIPSNSNNSSTIQVIGQNVTTVANQYSTPVKKNLPIATTAVTLESSIAKSSVFSTPGSHLENHKITTVHVGDSMAATAVPSVYGTCYTNQGPLAASTTPVLSKKIILSANTSGITNITVNTTETSTLAVTVTKSNVSAIDNNLRYNVGNMRYEKVFLSSSLPVVKPDRAETPTTTTLSPATTRATIPPLSPKMTTHLSSPQRQPNSIPKIDRLNLTAASSSSLPSSPTPILAFCALAIQTQKPSTSGQVLTPPSHTSVMRNNSKQLQSSLQPAPKADVGSESPSMQRKMLTPNHYGVTTADTPPVPTRTRFLTRGLTEAVITARPSRKDFCSPKKKTVERVEQQNSSSSNNSNATTSNNNIETMTSVNNCEISPSQTHSIVGRTRSESLEQRRRSSSTSEAQTQRTRVVTNNNEFIPNRAALGAAAMRMQQPPHSFRNLENGSLSPSIAATSSVTKRMTLREQQVMQLRREIMHPGGVRLQLRRKDCVGSIAWVDAFGAIWVAGWKQKEHPVLYNALHIGDQLLSIAGISITTAAEANKVIRNTNTLFVEVLIRRIPFGRGYAIRRDREGQCLGLIRDGNTSTIVDVVPNSLAARHGLPPKAQSCDGSTLTFWMLTEINGRTLNLFFKENEIRDRLNSVGRDISIMVQPSDLITKLKKQLKSLRGYKDYLVQ